jgi:site-specific DNA-cytosine methylase
VQNNKGYNYRSYSPNLKGRNKQPRESTDTVPQLQLQEERQNYGGLFNRCSGCNKQIPLTYKKIDIKQPEDKGIVLKDIIESGDTERLKSYCITATYSRACPEDYFNHGQRQLIFKKPVRVGHYNKGGQGDRIYSVDGKSVCLSANGGGRGAKTGLYEVKELVRKLTPIECARLQGYPDLYCSGISNSQAYKCYGNSFTVPVIEHLLKHIFT